MKTTARALAMLLLGALLFSLGACREEAPQLTFEDIYIVLPGEKPREDPFAKYNILTGERTPLCPDPVCKHTSEDGCLFTNVMSYGVDGSDVFFVHQGKIYKDVETGVAVQPETILHYNYDTGEIRELCTVPGTRFDGIQGGLRFSENYIYYCRRSGDPRENLNELWRVSRGGGEPEKTCVKTAWRVEAVVNDLAYCYEAAGTYTVDLATGERSWLCRPGDGTSFSVQAVEADGSMILRRGGEGSVTFSRVRPDGSEETILHLASYSGASYAGDMIYYSDENGEAEYAYSIPEGKTYFVCPREPETYKRVMTLGTCRLGVLLSFYPIDPATPNTHEERAYLVKDFTPT